MDIEKNSPRSSGLFWFGLGVLVIVLDQLTKYVAFHSRPALLFSRLGVRTFKNFNFAFSLPLPGWLMYGLYAAVLLVIGRYLFVHWGKFSGPTRLGWLMIVAGAVSNIVERLALGYVRDFLMINTGFLNFADVAILLGISLLIFQDFGNRYSLRWKLWRKGKD